MNKTSRRAQTTWRKGRLCSYISKNAVSVSVRAIGAAGLSTGLASDASGKGLAPDRQCDEARAYAEWTQPNPEGSDDAVLRDG